MIYIHLFYEFFITGLFMIGGGLAAIPFLQQMGENTGWFTTVELMDIIAISEATPGPIGVNMATYVGYTVSGVPGGIIATLGLLTPSIIIASIVARLLTRFRDSTLVNSTLYGLRPASLGLIAAAGIAVFSLVIFGVELHSLTNMHLQSVDFKALLLAAILFVVTNRFNKAHPIVFLAASAVIGIIVF
ncbi:MAG: chromate transporter [Oscillospiraceae bacterium]|jgi:chromate transporter|nr:chromate transporter [Oscillospiraceae bacterium]